MTKNPFLTPFLSIFSPFLTDFCHFGPKIALLSQKSVRKRLKLPKKGVDFDPKWVIFGVIFDTFFDRFWPFSLCSLKTFFRPLIFRGSKIDPIFDQSVKKCQNGTFFKKVDFWQKVPFLGFFAFFGNWMSISGKNSRFNFQLCSFFQFLPKMPKMAKKQGG